MRKLNLNFGLLLFVIFLLTGYYMEAYFKPAHIDNLTLRMEVRANHIYILFISLLNIMAFKSTFSGVKKFTVYLANTSGVLLIVSGLIALYAFMYDHSGNLIGRGETLTSIICALTAVGLFLINECIQALSSKP